MTDKLYQIETGQPVVQQSIPIPLQPQTESKQVQSGPVPNPRPSWDQYFMNITKEVSTRSTCMSAQFGAIIVKEGRIISSGYNGAPRRTRDSYEWGFCMRRKLGIPSGQRYEICRSVHAEQNAIINAARAATSPVDGDMYLYGKRIYGGKEEEADSFPCFICKKIIINAGIRRVFSHTKEGTIRSFDIENDWIREWQQQDMVDDAVKHNIDYKR
jgi:dCMP deaminase